MRLDHLLSTENTVHVFGQCVPHDGVTVMPYSVDAGVEEIMGLDVPSGCPGVVWVCFWAPGPPPHGFSVARFDAHAWWPVLGGWSDRVARGGLRTG